MGGKGDRGGWEEKGTEGRRERGQRRVGGEGDRGGWEGKGTEEGGRRRGQRRVGGKGIEESGTGGR